MGELFCCYNIGSIKYVTKYLSENKARHISNIWVYNHFVPIFKIKMTIHIQELHVLAYHVCVTISSCISTVLGYL
jgi:hypothetical protein